MNKASLRFADDKLLFTIPHMPAPLPYQSLITYRILHSLDRFLRVQCDAREEARIRIDNWNLREYTVSYKITLRFILVVYRSLLTYIRREDDPTV